jgi:myo-inositol-1(or 4)-monophosphatase
VIDYCWLARGRFDAFYESGLNLWDRAAGALIAAEAGAIVRTLPAAPGGQELYLAAKPGIAEQLSAALIAAGAAG